MLTSAERLPPVLGDPGVEPVGVHNKSQQVESDDGGGDLGEDGVGGDVGVVDDAQEEEGQSETEVSAVWGKYGS